MGRTAKIARDPYVLTHEEVVRDYFRRAPSGLPPAELANLKGFPRPGPSGLYHRKAVEAWVDLHYGFSPKSVLEQQTNLALELASGRRRDPAPAN